MTLFMAVRRVFMSSCHSRMSRCVSSSATSDMPAYRACQIRTLASTLSPTVPAPASGGGGGASPR